MQAGIGGGVRTSEAAGLRGRFGDFLGLLRASRATARWDLRRRSCHPRRFLPLAPLHQGPGPRGRTPNIYLFSRSPPDTPTDAHLWICPAGNQARPPGAELGPASAPGSLGSPSAVLPSRNSKGTSSTDPGQKRVLFLLPRPCSPPQRRENWVRGGETPASARAPVGSGLGALEPARGLLPPVLLQA